MIGPAWTSNPDSPITVAIGSAYCDATNSATEAGYIQDYASLIFWHTVYKPVVYRFGDITTFWSKPLVFRRFTQPNVPRT